MSFISFERIQKYIYALSMIIMINAAGSAQCDYTLACNDMVQISLSTDCTQTVTADMIIENPEFSESNYVVVLELPDGTELDEPIITVDHIGMVLTAKVTLIFNNCNITCWGNLIVEDKLPPTVDCPMDMTVDCGISFDPSDIGGITLGDVTDCSGVDTLFYIDESEVLLCADIYSEILTRTWHVIDNAGNDRVCEQIFYIRSADIENTIMPADYIVACEDLTIPVDELTPEVTGKPTMIECANVQSYYTDLDFPLCGNGFKKRREWHVLDWCTGQDTVGYQTIKIEDTQDPVVNCGLQFYEIPSNTNACFATYTVPLPVNLGEPVSDPASPVIVSDCSEVSYRIYYATFPPNLECNSLEDAQEVLEANGDVLDFVEVFPNSNGDYIIDQLPNGCNWIQYVFDDGCGHQTMCTKDIFVYDNAPPAAICEGFTVVTIDEDGWSHLNAESLDDHSWDYCDGELIFTARRTQSECSDLPPANPDDEDFDEFIHFCCQDVGAFIEVELKVMDLNGNYNFCTVSVYVDDKTPPLVQCPGDLTLDCSQDYMDINLTGMPTFTDNCQASIHQNYEEFLNDCGLGYVVIEHAIWDNASNQVVCTQRIDIVNENKLTYDDVDWPDDINGYTCDPSFLDPEISGSEPDYSGYISACSDIGVSMSDLTFHDVEGACLKIVRTWTLVDWCVSPVEYVTHVQKILIFNTDAPEFENCADYENTVNEDCAGEVDILINVTDDCTKTGDLDINWQVDLFSNGDMDDSGSGRAINEFYPPGVHTVMYSATDECGNTSECEFDLTILDYSDTPTPVCLTEVVWVLDPNGQATIWASDFNFKSFDGCNGEEGLNFYFDDSFSESSKVMDFDCSDLETDGIEEMIPLKMYVRDEDGNFDYCDVTLILQDNGNDACDDISNSNMGRVEGTVYDINMVGIEEIMMSLEEMSEHFMFEQMTGQEGLFAFDEIAYFGEYQITPEKDGDYLEGVSTLDLVLMQKHILGIDKFTSPYQMIAADVNGSNSISAVDLIEIRKLILGVYDAFPNQDSWDFVSMNTGEPFMANPWDYQDSYYLGALYESMAKVDFVAVKIGDVNGSYSELVQDEVASRSNKLLTLTQHQKENTIILSQETNELINGFQMIISLPSEVHVVDVTMPGKENFDGNSWSFDGELLTIVYADVINQDNIELHIHTDSEQVIDHLQFSELISAEAYNINDDILNLKLRANEHEEDLNLSANYPNPFVQTTRIECNVPSNEAIFTVTDINGSIHYSQVLASGHTVIELSAASLNGVPGLYFYTIKTKDDVITKSLFLIE